MPAPKITISPGQGLLVLIDHYKQDEERREYLKQLYLSGAETPQIADDIRALLQDPVLDAYVVSYTPQTIDEDSSRRYFETHLAYETLKTGLDCLGIEELLKHRDSLWETICWQIPEEERRKINYIFEGKFKIDEFKDVDVFEADIEFSDFMDKIIENKIFNKSFNTESKRKIILTVQCAYLGLMVCWNNATPLNLYEKGFYLPEQRGREEKAAQDKLRHHHMGLMKPHMPLFPGDIAIRGESFPYLKASDKSSFTEDAAWVQYNFSQMVHPFSNSISGTMLTQLRACAYLKQKGIETFAYSETDMTQFCKLYISALLFNAGGHSLFEFSSPLFLSEVKQEFKFKTMSLKSMFFDNNEAAFNQALNAAIAYNQSILVRKKVLTELLLSKSAQKSEQRLLVGLSLAINCKSDMDTYSTLVKDQSLYAFRPGHKKLDLIESHGQKALNDLKVGQLSKALNKFQHLKMILTSQYGSTTCWGGKPASIAMLDFVEEALATVIETIAAEHRQIDGPQEAELPPSATSP